MWKNNSKVSEFNDNSRQNYESVMSVNKIYRPICFESEEVCSDNEEREIEIQHGKWMTKKDRAASFYFYWKTEPTSQNSENLRECFKLFIVLEIAELISNWYAKHFLEQNRHLK